MFQHSIQSDALVVFRICSQDSTTYTTFVQAILHIEYISEIELGLRFVKSLTKSNKHINMIT